MFPKKASPEFGESQTMRYFPYDFFMISLWFPHGFLWFPMISLWFPMISYDVPYDFLWFPSCVYISSDEIWESFEVTNLNISHPWSVEKKTRLSGGAQPQGFAGWIFHDKNEMDNRFHLFFLRSLTWVKWFELIKTLEKYIFLGLFICLFVDWLYNWYGQKSRFLIVLAFEGYEISIPECFFKMIYEIFKISMV